MAPRNARNPSASSTCADPRQLPRFAPFPRHAAPARGRASEGYTETDGHSTITTTLHL